MRPAILTRLWRRLRRVFSRKRSSEPINPPQVVNSDALVHDVVVDSGEIFPDLDASATFDSTDSEESIDFTSHDHVGPSGSVIGLNFGLRNQSTPKTPKPPVRRFKLDSFDEVNHLIDRPSFYIGSSPDLSPVQDTSDSDNDVCESIVPNLRKVGISSPGLLVLKSDGSGQSSDSDEDEKK